MFKYNHQLIHLIADILKGDPYLTENLNGIFFNVQKEVKYPYILISYEDISNFSTPHKFNYKINFLLSLFVRDYKNHFLIITSV